MRRKVGWNWCVGLVAGVLGGVSLQASASPESVFKQSLEGRADRFEAGPSQGAVPGAWWKTLGVPVLEAWVEEGLQNNHSLQAAWERVEQARQYSNQAGSLLLPSVQVQGGGYRNSTEGLLQQLAWQTGGTVPDQVSDYLGEQYDTAQWSLSANWLVDLFGSATSAWVASRWDARAAQGQRAAQSMATAHQVGATVFDWMASKEAEQVILRQIAAQEELLEASKLRMARAESSALDVLMQEQQLALTKAALPSVETQIGRAEGRLATLLGRPERDVALDELSGSSLPEPEMPQGIGTPLDLLRNRPDLRMAAATMEASKRREWSAWLGLLPALSLTASTGETGQKIGAADDAEWQTAGSWSFGVSASIPLFSGGRLFSAARGARATAQASEYDFQGALLGAVREVEDAWTFLEQTHREVEAYETSAQAARDAGVLAREQYLAGVLPTINLLAAEQSQLQAELALIQMKRARLTAHVGLHDAIGAPWAVHQARNKRVFPGDEP